jgi:hypothetical protein
MKAHTPGPWVTAKAGSGIKARVISETVGYCVAQAYHDPSWNEKTYDELAAEAEANAYLIAAAPQMLEAIQYVIDWHREHDSGEGELFGLDFVTTCINARREARGELIPAQPKKEPTP